MKKDILSLQNIVSCLQTFITNGNAEYEEGDGDNELTTSGGEAFVSYSLDSALIENSDVRNLDETEGAEGEELDINTNTNEADLSE